MLHGRPFFFFSHFYVYRIDGVPPENLLFVRNFLFCATTLIFKRFGIEAFWRGIDRARLLLWLLDLALFVYYLPVLALLLHLHALALPSDFFFQTLFPAADFLEHLLVDV